MNINVEFLSREPMENVITSIHFRLDKVIFFGFEEEIQKQRKALRRFLKEDCKVENVIFQSVSHHDMDSCIKVMRNVLEAERKKDDHLYFDLTGGESFIMTAFGILATEIKAPLHVYDVVKDQIHEMKEFSPDSILQNVPEQTVKMTIERMIRLHGGAVNVKLHKAMKEDVSPELIETLWNISTKYQKAWNDFTAVMRCFSPPVEGSIDGWTSRSRMQKEIRQCEKLDDGLFRKIARECREKGLIREMKLDGESCTIQYPSQTIKDFLWDGGAVLEMHTKEKMKQESDDCEAGIHIDWDGIFSERDVLNEIDVIAMKGNVPVFISCKNGRLGKTQSLHALYELAAVADRFGGKYVRKIMVAPQGLYSETDELRAEEMGIEVRAE